MAEFQTSGISSRRTNFAVRNAFTSAQTGIRKEVLYAIVLCALIATASTLLFFDSDQVNINLPLAEKDTTRKVVRSAAIYAGKGTWNESVVALENLFRWLNYSVVLVDGAFIMDRGLENFSIFCVPGGDMYEYSVEITPNGIRIIQGFIGRGGGYLGICGGSYFAAEKVVWMDRQLPMNSLGFFKGTAEGPINQIVPYPNYTVSKVDIVDRGHPVSSSLPEYYWMLYYWGPFYRLEVETNVAILGKYSDVELPAVLVVNYHNGRVFLVGGHPEIEENSLRDGGRFAESLDDPETDWPLLVAAVKWLEG